jgi:RHS repeat-associated protein
MQRRNHARLVAHVTVWKVWLTRSVADSTSGRDAADRWTSASLQLTGQSALTMGRTFNGAGNLTAQSGAGYTSGNSATYTYDPASGQKATESIPLAFGGTIAESYTYYPDGRIHYYRQTGGIFGQYQYDSFGNLAAASDNSNAINFTYNAANELTQSSDDGDVTQYGWDTTNGWRTSQGPTSNPTQIQYAYNAQGRMTSYSDSDDGISATYAYDAAGQRTKSVVNVRGTVTTTNWVYEGETLLSLTATQGSSSWRIDYLHDENGVPYGGVYRSPATSTSPTYFTMVTDGRGDVVELLDAAGNPFAAYHYDAWGWINEGYDNFNGIQTQGTSLINSTLASAIVAQQHLTYAGYVYDSESNLYYCNARYYDPATRQWTTADPAKADGEESSYQYSNGNPVAFSDPTGQQVGGHWVYKYVFSNINKDYAVRVRWIGSWQDHGWQHATGNTEESWSIESSFTCGFTIPGSTVAAGVGVSVTYTDTVGASDSISKHNKECWVSFSKTWFMTSFTVKKYKRWWPTGKKWKYVATSSGIVYTAEGWQNDEAYTKNSQTAPSDPQNSN